MITEDLELGGQVDLAKADVAAVIAVSAPRVMNVRNVEIALSVKNVPAAW